MPSYRVLLRRVIEGSVYIDDAENEVAAERAAESMMERGDASIDWLEPEDEVCTVEPEPDE